MDIILDKNYIDSAYSENKRTGYFLLFIVKTFFGIYWAGPIKKPLHEGRVARFVRKISDDMVQTYVDGNLSLNKVVELLTKDANKIKDADSLNNSIKKLIVALTKNSERLEKVNYFKNERLRIEFKKALKTCYIIEAKSKTLMIQRNPIERKPDELFELLASQPKTHLSQSV